MHFLARVEFKPFKNALIKLFIKAFHVDMSIAEKENPHDYKSFNAFFTRKLKKDARKMVIDDDYIRQSLIDPLKHIAEGYTPIMPSYKPVLSDKDITHLIAYIKSLK